MLVNIHQNVANPTETDVETWLHEVNEIILKVDMGELPNKEEYRKFAKWRLSAVERYFNNKIDHKFKSTYNSLWSQLYRLEHSAEFEHPYIKTLIEQLCKQTPLKNT
ncbi:hypothetical protein LC040_00515 [Bacillus tianshenii]|nr:hypothetical protein LC040_00515 [Bacillus tianshenii]